MLTILKENRDRTEQIFLKERPTTPKHDITVNKVIEKVDYNKDGSRTIKEIIEKINITRQINETAKVVKIENAQQKLEELRKMIK